MKKACFTIICCLCIVTAFSQSLKKYDIGSSGCKAYFFCDPGEAEKDYSPDSSEVYAMECEADSAHCGLICVKYSASLLPVNNAEDLMIQYLDYLKENFKIKEAAGYGKGHTMSSYDKATGVIDYWKDEEGNEWKIKSWTDGEYIGFMYVYANGKLGSDMETRFNVFLDGFRFPGM